MLCSGNSIVVAIVALCSLVPMNEPLGNGGSSDDLANVISVGMLCSDNSIVVAARRVSASEAGSSDNKDDSDAGGSPDGSSSSKDDLDSGAGGTPAGNFDSVLFKRLTLESCNGEC